MSTATVPAIILRCGYASDAAWQAAIQSCLTLYASAGRHARRVDKEPGVVWIVLAKPIPEPVDTTPALAWDEEHAG